MVGRARAKGHRKLAYVGPSKGAESSVDRWKGFNAALDGLDLVLHISEVGGKALPMLEAIRKSGATVAFFTELADAVVVDAAARSQSLAVPGDLSIVVLGSPLLPMQTGTRFTTFSIPREEMARRATQMLCERIEASTRGGQVLLGCEAVEGDTLGIVHQQTDLN